MPLLRSEEQRVLQEPLKHIGRQISCYIFTTMKKIIFLTCLLSLTSVVCTAQSRLINLDYTNVKGPHNKFFREVVGAGRAAEGLRADWQRDLALVHRECGFKYIRFHGLLQDELDVYREDREGKPIYNFQNIDVLYDAILKVGMRPFVELSFMPQALASGTKTIFWWKANISPPKDYGKWETLTRALVQHWTERYGAEEVKQWYFEVWNEPNLDIFWSGNQGDYFKLYETTVRAVKSVSQEYRVGGPATAGRGWIRETINFAVIKHVPLDFVTTHDYGVKGIGFDQGHEQLQLITDAGAIVNGVRDSRSQITNSPLPKLPLHYTEWSTSYSSRDPVHDSYISAAYILEKLKGSEGYADSMSYWTFTDIFEESGPAPTPFHGGFGLVNFNGLRKPSFYAYQFLNKLGDTELKSTDASSWSCKSANGVQVLLWNFTNPSTSESNQKYFKRDNPAKDAAPVQVSLQKLPPGLYNFKLFRVGYGANDVYGEFLKLGSPENLSREQLRQLSEKTDGRAVISDQFRIGKKGSFEYEVKMHENDVVLMMLEKQ